MAHCVFAPLLLALLAAPTADAGALRQQLREQAQQQVLVAEANETAASPAGAGASSPAGVTPPLAHLLPHDEEHSGTPGNGGQPMVPRSHVPVGHATPSSEFWSYEAPQNWATSYAQCNGHGQSPVNIDWVKAVTSASKQNVAYLAQHGSYHPLGGRSIRNNGHNLQVDGDFGSLALPDGQYGVRQFSFHFPSEHEVNGKLAAGELQIVHQRQGSEGTDNLAVISVMLEVTDLFAEELAFFENLGFGEPSNHSVNHLALLPREHDDFHVPADVDLNAFAKQLQLGFWHYEGSLTTPPCTEAVHWYVLQHPAAVTQAMVNSFKALFPPPSNSRPVQPLNGRKVFFSEVGVPGEFPPTAEANPVKSAAFRAAALAALVAAGLQALLP